MSLTPVHLTDTDGCCIPYLFPPVRCLQDLKQKAIGIGMGKQLGLYWKARESKEPFFILAGARFKMFGSPLPYRVGATK